MSMGISARVGASVLAMALVSACGGSGGETTASTGGSGTGVTVVPPATPTPSTPTPTTPAPTAPTPTPSTPTPSPAATGWAGVAAALYDTLPDLAGCRAGVLKASVRQQALADVNRIRALHGLAPVAYADGDDGQIMDASLMMAANGALSHTPPSSWTCYTQAGSTGAGSSNLYLARGTGLGFLSADDHMAAWINEGGSSSLGHRRWILHPFLGRMAYARFAVQRSDGSRLDAATMKVFGFTAGRPAPAFVPAFVAVPQGDYPSRYFRASDHLSFSVVPSATNDGSDRRVSFANARITVTGPSGAMTVGEQASDNDGYGLANNLQWRIQGLQPGTSYTVRISGVAGAPASEYSYSFRITG